MTSGKVAIISLVMGIVAAVVVAFGVQSMATVVVPDTKLKGEEAARAVAQAVGLGFAVVQERPSRLVPLGSVIEQVPAPGVRALKGSAVLATVSLGPEDRIPAIDLPAIPKPETPVAAAPPKEGAPAKEADAAAAAAAKAEREEVAVPKLYRMRVASAKQMLENDGLKLGKITSSFNEDLPFGVIFRQEPRPGNMVRLGTEVAVTVNAEAE